MTDDALDEAGELLNEGTSGSSGGIEIADEINLPPFGR